MKKTFALLSVLGLTACGSPPPPPVFQPLDYSYLRPYTFKVANISVVNAYTPGSDEAALNANSPAPLGPTAAAMLNHRFLPSGEPGNAIITVQTASVTEAAGNLNGQLTIDINLTSADGRSTGFAESTVKASNPAPDGDNNSADMQTALYQMTKQLMNAINVQLPYQIMHSTPSWVAWTTPQGAAPAGATTGAIEATPLTGPPGSTVTTTTTTTPGVPAPLAPATVVPIAPAPVSPSVPSPPMGNLVPPGYPGAPVPLAPAQ